MKYDFSLDKPFFSQWKEMLKSFSSVLKQGDIELLTDFASHLGTTDTQGQLQNIELYTHMLNEKITNAQNDIDNKSKLYKSLGLSLGIVISILFI